MCSESWFTFYIESTSHHNFLSCVYHVKYCRNSRKLVGIMCKRENMWVVYVFFSFFLENQVFKRIFEIYKINFFKIVSRLFILSKSTTTILSNFCFMHYCRIRFHLPFDTLLFYLKCSLVGRGWIFNKKEYAVTVA